ncbi:BrnA antitoxin family protein [bacterium]|nr:BrnA antitoxin family protein [bacterium]
MKKKLPDFKSEREEKEFWKTHNPMDYVDWSKADSVVDRFFKNGKNKESFLKDLDKKMKR